MNILVVYEEIPESTKFYSLAGDHAVDSEDWEWIQLCQGKFVNMTELTDEDDVRLDQLSKILEKLTPLPADNPIPGNYDYVLHTGFIL